MNQFYHAAEQITALDIRDALDQVLGKESVIAAIHHPEEDERVSEPSLTDDNTDKWVTPCRLDMLLTRKPSTEELRKLGHALKYSASDVLEPYAELVERLRYQSGISFAIVGRFGACRWLNDTPVQTACVLDRVAAYMEQLAKLARDRAERAKRRVA